MRHYCCTTLLLLIIITSSFYFYIATVMYLTLHRLTLYTSKRKLYASTIYYYLLSTICRIVSLCQRFVGETLLTVEDAMIPRYTAIISKD